MVITRHNYEEYFLMLADGELSPAQEELVLAFTHQHPDLAEELDSLMQCRLEAEIPAIFPKEKILKPVFWNVEHPDEIQVQLLVLLDNELAGAEKTRLEQQIADNKDLELEWNTLQTLGRLKADPPPSFPKEKLLKPTIWNIEEPDTIYMQMMTLLDNELPATERKVLGEKIAAEKGLQVEWQSLQQAKLPATAVVFPNKKILYREKEQRRIGGWMRWAAAAAVVIGLGGTFWPQSASVTDKDKLVIGSKTGKNSKATPPGIGEQEMPLNPGTANQQQKPLLPEANNASTDQVKSMAVAQQKKDRKNGVDGDGKQQMRPVLTHKKTDGINNNIDANDNSNNSSMALNNNAGIEDNEAVANKSRTVITGSVNDMDESGIMQPRQLNAITASMQHSKNDHFRTASYQDLTAAENADDDVIYIAGARLNKQKVRGVFRGITRSLGRTFSKSKVEPENEPPALSRNL
ncbi:MAG: hypothetical protein ABIX01_03415 [Chitinophagaceae bacterium]